MRRNLRQAIRNAMGAACMCAAVAGAVTMSVNGTSGPAKTFDIATIRKITFDLVQTPKMNVVLTSNSTQTIDIATVRSITFSGVTSPAQQAQVRRIKSGLISFAMRHGVMPSVSFTVDKPENVRIAIYTVAGELVQSVADRRFDAGDHTVFWDGKNGQGRTARTGNYIMKIDRPGRASAFKFVTVK